MSYSVFYFIQSFFDPLPWTKCDDGWENCYDSDANLTSLNLTGQVSSSELFFK